MRDKDRRARHGLKVFFLHVVTDKFEANLIFHFSSKFSAARTLCQQTFSTLFKSDHLRKMDDAPFVVVSPLGLNLMGRKREGKRDLEPVFGGHF